VAAFLAHRFGADVASVQPMLAGEWSAPYAFRAAGRDLVARFSPLEEDVRKDEAAAAFSSEALPVPPMIEIGRALGGWYAVTERRRGTYLEDASDREMQGLLQAVFRMLDAIRAADVSAMPGYGSWGGDGVGSFDTWPEALLAVGVDRPTLRIHGWRDALESWPGPAATFRDAFRALEELAPQQPSHRHLIHSDLIHGNVLVDGDRITAVLDWGSALYGDFLFDLAWLWFWAPWYPAWSAIDFRAEAARHLASVGLDVTDFATRVRACSLYIGLDGMAFQAWSGRGADLERTARRTLEVLRDYRCRMYVMCPIGGPPRGVLTGSNATDPGTSAASTPPIARSPAGGRGRRPFPDGQPMDDGSSQA
jgi:hygromycin-B 4-O-kinase